MTSNRKGNGLAYALLATLALGTAAASAADTKDEAVSPGPITVAQAGTPSARAAGAVPTAAMTGDPLQAGVRKAASEGPTALRRYVLRTKPIYNHYYWDFAKYLPPE